MRFVTPSTFKSVQKCAESFVASLEPPKDYEWLPFIQRDWISIVGSDLAAQTSPGRLWFARPGGSEGVLTVFVMSQGAALVLHHETAFMRDAVNAYYKQIIVRTVRVQVQI